MGGMAYLAVNSGMLLLSTRSATDVAQQADARLEVFWILAFLAGFSDKFYEGVIDLLVGKALGGTDPEAEAADELSVDSEEAPKLSTDAGTATASSSTNNTVA